MSASTHITTAAPDRLEDLEALRGQAGISQASLCRRAGIAASTYQRWLKYMRSEEGGVRPQPRTLKVVSEALSVELAARDPSPSAQMCAQHAA